MNGLSLEKEEYEHSPNNYSQCIGVEKDFSVIELHTIILKTILQAN